MSEVENLSEHDLRKTLVQQLESLRMAGLTHLPTGSGQYAFEAMESEPEPEPVGNMPPIAPVNKQVEQKREQPQLVKESPAVATPAAKPAANTPTVPIGTNTGAYGASLQLNDRKSALAVIKSEVEACTKCEELSSKRTNTVFGVGNPAARLVFVGEAPGMEEDKSGEPFVGEAGNQLNKIIKACKLSREEVFILNTVKCRPPANRNPAQGELANCWNYAERQLEILQPEFIVCLGSVAAKTLLQTTLSLGKLRRQFHSYRGSRVLVTYHPAYLLRTPSAKRHVWDDMKMLMQEMGIDWTK